MTTPKYQPIVSDNIPEVALAERAGRVRVIAGSFDGVQGAASTWSPIDMWDVTVEPAGCFDFIVTEVLSHLAFKLRQCVCDSSTFSP